jgi:hypothetical protein
MVAHACNSTSWEAKNVRIKVQGQPRQKVIKAPISTNKPDVVLCTCNPSYVGGRSRRIVGPGQPQAKT